MKQPVEINIVGSSVFGRYPKISSEKTYNMFISDNWLVNYAGFKKTIDIFPAGEGRALFNSIRGNFLIIVVASTIYKMDSNFVPNFLGQLNTLTGDVYIDENLDNQICIVDGESAYIYNYFNDTFTKQTLTFLSNPIFPSYVCYHNTFFLIGSSPISINSQNWYAFEVDTPTTIKLNTQFSIQTKPDTALLIARLPGRGNNVIVLGSTVGEIWTQIGGEANYSRVQSFNIDDGLVSISTFAASDEYVCWLSQNENNSPCIMLAEGSTTKRLSTDGIDFLLSEINFPKQSSAFFYRQDGHLFYQLTFYNPADNLSLIYDFATGMFFHVSDENLNFHPARDIVYFNGDSYFISIRDGSIYRMDTTLVTYDYEISSRSEGEEIPRVRICKSIRKPDSSVFRVNGFTFWLEQGTIPISAETQSRVDMSYSKNGNESFSNIVSRPMNPTGKYRNQIRWHRMGQCNEFTIQLKLWGFQRFVCSNGMLEIY